MARVEADERRRSGRGGGDERQDDDGERPDTFSLCAIPCGGAENPVRADSRLL